MKKIQKDGDHHIGSSQTVHANFMSARILIHRWQGIQVYSGMEGIAVQRESRRMNMWLYDLCLAEYLANEINFNQFLILLN